tara:strand:+ start:444 stop:599 length:156 start_codon:yes stop_codon:yes gene_type:complete
MFTIKDFETMIPDKIIGVDMHNKNTVIFITSGKIKIMHKRSKHGITQSKVV